MLGVVSGVSFPVGWGLAAAVDIHVVSLENNLNAVTVEREAGQVQIIQRKLASIPLGALHRCTVRIILEPLLAAVSSVIWQRLDVAVLTVVNSHGGRKVIPPINFRSLYSSNALVIPVGSRME